MSRSRTKVDQTTSTSLQDLTKPVLTIGFPMYETKSTMSTDTKKTIVTPDVKSFTSITPLMLHKFKKKLESNPRLTEGHSTVFLDQIVRNRSKLNSLLDYLKNLDPQLTANPKELSAIDIEAARVQFPTIGTAEIHAAMTKGESLSNLYTKIRALHLDTFIYERHVNCAKSRYSWHNRELLSSNVKITKMEASPAKKI